jgi:hypothetical protein
MTETRFALVTGANRAIGLEVVAQLSRLGIFEGADTPVWLATLPDDGPTGGFFENRRPTTW